ncbi:unnamed protein product [Cercopithifilaria johnstoni]|uniref:Uncharacterized protein n=1 Tax=Cercopithifilaria johnstoni TaxID=2874296 RepID=A0A8J2MC26_9BILA|nr:unnamed protein product [Cercopithifilaria johnstoni]
MDHTVPHSVPKLREKLPALGQKVFRNHPERKSNYPGSCHETSFLFLISRTSRELSGSCEARFSSLEEEQERFQISVASSVGDILSIRSR